MLYTNLPEGNYENYTSDNTYGSTDYELEDTNYLIDFNELCELETNDLPETCPYRQVLNTNNPLVDFNTRKIPTAPPPNYTPAKSEAKVSSSKTKAVDAFSLRPCVNRIIYIWPKNGRGFWAYVTFVGRRSLAGFRWNGRRWFYFGMSLRNVDAFFCG
ncbi:hypothetical protein IAI10_06495 [Clostridium sp. 19966]|uniref:hypothetical protein n=1 Tax=Clostridium sp. 19966 TaxID=2768166 RepID=UPI0028DEC267|nr:hypothetical protein [Clostridium sp. 19966]MDT8716300.1 hypothetical protein [Clostridium sp. 19966]